MFTQPVPAYGGDKISFRSLDEGNEDCADAIRKITAAIEAYRWHKRGVKREIEAAKEGSILKVDEVAEQKLYQAVGDLAGVKPPQSVEAMRRLVEHLDRSQQQELDVARARISAEKVNAHRDVLHRYHAKVKDACGWRWPELKQAIAKAVPGIVMDDIAINRRTGIVVIKVPGRGTGEDSRSIYQVLVGPTRFGPGPDDEPSWGGVYTKVAYQGYLFRTSKQYVFDSNKVLTRRYVTRAVTIFHLATMFGFEIRPQTSEVHPLDVDLPPRLQRRVDRLVAPDIVAGYIDDPRGRRRLAEQVPRYRGGTFGAHATMFNLGRAAVVAEDVPTSCFKPYGKPDVVTLEKTGIRSYVGTATGLTGTSPMDMNEAASMQVRNGSGPAQTFLSTASVQLFGKVIRANKGERFDTGAENQATLEVDLSLALHDQVLVVNQHVDDSHRYKIAYDRFFDMDDITALERKVAWRILDLQKSHREKLLSLLKDRDDRWLSEGVEAVAGALVKAGCSVPDLGLTADDVKDLSQTNVLLVMSLRGNEITDLPARVKRKAEQELDEYVYSARKNREVLMNRIPLSCITGIKFNHEPGKWPGFGTAFGGFTPTSSGWYGFSDVQDALRAYLTDDDCARMKEMFVHAMRGKREESGRT